MQTSKTISNRSHNEQCHLLVASLQSSLSIVASLSLACVFFHTTFKILSLVLSLIHSFALCYR